MKAYGWLRRQESPIISVLLEHQQGDLSWVLDLAAEDKPKRKERHLRMLGIWRVAFVGGHGMKAGKELFTVAEVAEILALSERTSKH